MATRVMRTGRTYEELLMEITQLKRRFALLDGRYNDRLAELKILKLRMRRIRNHIDNLIVHPFTKDSSYMSHDALRKRGGQG